MRKVLGLLMGIILSIAGCSGDSEVEEVTINDDSIRIAAVGDSITAEYTPNAGYPEILDDMLGGDYAVVNFGESNYAAQASSDFPYETTDSYQKSLQFNPDIVILMLGTNDTKAVNWEGPERFKAEYTELAESYLSLESEPRVILVSPPTVFAEAVFRGSIDSNRIPAVRQAVAAVADELSLEYIDMTEKTKNQPEWFFDGIHPTSEGATEMAQIIYSQIKK